MKKSIFAFAAVALLALACATPPAAAQTLMPIPSGMCSIAGQLLVANDANNATCSSVISKIASYTATVVAFGVAANSCTVKSYTVTGLTTADKVFISPGVVPSQELTFGNALVAAADTLEITFCNPRAVVVDPEAGTVNVIAIRS